MDDLTELSWDAGDKVSMLADSLHKRVEREIERLLAEQLGVLGVELDKTLPSCASFPNYQGLGGFKRKLYPDDPEILCVYEYDGQVILAVKVGPNGMSIQFDTPQLEPHEGRDANRKG